MSLTKPEKKPVAANVSSDDPHACSVEEVLQKFQVAESGLSKKEVEKRRKKYGSNEFTEVKQDGIFKQIFDQLRSPLVFVLVIAFGVTAALQEYVDSFVILFAVSIAVVVGVLQEGKASRAFKKLSESQVRVATVIRNGAKQEIPAGQLVPGDIIEIHNGMQVPADARVIKAKKLSTNEAALTGEWLPVGKQTDPVAVGIPFAEQSSMVRMGTFVSEGYGLAVVTATGDKTAVGQLAIDVQAVEDELTPLQHEMRKISMVMLYIIGALTIFIFIIGLWQAQPLQEMLLMSIAIAVASVPEGLPAAVTIILAIGMEALLKRGGLVRNLLAAETLGSTTYVLTDKTGTLTEARMALTGIIHREGTNFDAASWKQSEFVRFFVEVSLAAADAYVDAAASTKTETVLRGDPVERAVLETAQSVGLSLKGQENFRTTRSDYLAFTSENRFAAGVAPHEGKYILCINGAPEYLLEKASHVDHCGQAKKITAEDREYFSEAIAEQTKEGRRLVGVAFKQVSYDDIPDDDPESVVEKITFLGVIVLSDPVRAGIKDAITGVRNAGAEILLITGDNPQTALSVARAVGIVGARSAALTGDDLVEMSDEEILAAIAHTKVFARVLPRQKMRIAGILQQQGEIVAMTGDGVNDAPALRKANIGVSVGSGTEVAKEASDLVLINDSFATMYAAIEEGRRIVGNLRKIVGYLLSTSLSEVVLVGAAIITGAAVPILPAQILWANVIEEGLMSVAFAFEKGEPGAMKRKPQDIHAEGILSAQMLWFMAFVITTLSALSLALYFYLRSLDIPLTELRSAMFLSIAIDSLFMAFAFRSLTVPVWRIPLKSNIFFIGSFVISAALLAIVLTIPLFRQLLSYEPLPFFDILLVLGFSFAALVTIEVAKWVFFEHRYESAKMRT